jgi:hypothetical protein
MQRIAETPALALTVLRRESDRRVVVAVTVAGVEQFTRPIWIQDKEERKKLVDELCSQFPGIDTEGRIALRDRLNQLRKEHELDIEFHLPHKINGTGKVSVDYYSGSRITWASNTEMINDATRRTFCEKIAAHHLGKTKTLPKLKRLADQIETRLLAELQGLRKKMTTPPPRPVADDDEPAPYEYVEGVGIYWLKSMMGGGVIPKRLSNFTARITAEVGRDDGSGDVQREFEVEMKTPNASTTFSLPSSDFQEMRWPMDRFGTRGHVWPGQGIRDLVRDAIVRMSGEPPQKHVHTCPGWVKTDAAGWAYLHGGGVICGGDVKPAIDVELDAGIANVVLPAPTDDAFAIRTALKASLRILELTKPEIAFPVYSCIGRAPLGWSDFIVNLVGRTGNFKSELQSLATRHFGRDLHAKNQTASWESTVNAIGEQQFLARDVLLGVDDFKLKGSPNDQMRQHAKADTVYRWQGNGTGKGRMNAAGGLRRPRKPRGTVLSSSEHIPQGESCRGRGLHVQVSPGDIPADKLTECQRDAESGAYAIAMAAYVRWLAQDGRIERLRGGLPELIRKYRQRAQESDLHRRTPEIVANLYVGLRCWLGFCTEAGAITAEEEKSLKRQAWAALGKAAQQQLEHQAGSEPVARYLELITSALGSGRAHLADADGRSPADDVAIACGWWRRSAVSPWEPRSGTCIGYITPDGIFLIPDAAYAAAQGAAGAGGSGLFEPEPELRKRLEEKGALQQTDGGKFNRRTVRKTFAGMLRPVLWLKPGVLPLPCARSARNEATEGAGTAFFGTTEGVEA